MKKILAQFRNLDAAVRLWLAAGLAALAVHLLLLGLFRYAPREQAPGGGELPPVGSIDLSVRENRDLQLWIRYHDPAAMTAPDGDFGYSQVVRTTGFRPGVEDLPLPPQLSAPRPPLPPALPKTVLSKDSDPVLASSLRWKTGVPRLPETQVAAHWEGRILPDLSLRLSDYLASAANRKTWERYPEDGFTTEIEIAPERLPGLGMRLRLAKSCGEKEFDQVALLLVGAWLRRTPSLSGAGQLSIDWGAAPRKAKRDEVKK